MNKHWTKFEQHQASARYRGLSHELTEEEWCTLIAGPCAYCGGPSEGGIDRRDSTVGYIVQNCVPACKRCNSRKGCFEHLGVEEAVRRTIALGWRNASPSPSQREWRMYGPWKYVKE